MHRVELTLTVFVDGASGDKDAIRAARAYAEESARDSVEMADFSHCCETWSYPPRGVVITAGKKPDEEGWR